MFRLFLLLVALFLNIQAASADNLIKGTFKFSQFVTLETGEKEVKAVEGVIYISGESFTTLEKKTILNTGIIRQGTELKRLFDRDLLNSCVVMKPLVNTAHSMLSSGKVLTRTRVKGKEGANIIKVRGWVDWAYYFSLSEFEGVISLTSSGGLLGFGFKSERFEIQKVKNEGLKSCLEFDDELDKSLILTNKENQLKLFESLLSSARQKVTDKRFKEALSECKKGVESLGYKYRIRGTKDDTGLKLSLSKIMEREGNIEVAANLTCNMLETRISLYKLKVDSV